METNHLNDYGDSHTARYTVKGRRVFNASGKHVANITGYREIYRGAVTPDSGYYILAVDLTRSITPGSYAYYDDARRAAIVGCVEMSAS